VRLQSSASGLYSAFDDRLPEETTRWSSSYACWANASSEIISPVSLPTCRLAGGSTRSSAGDDRPGPEIQVHRHRFEDDVEEFARRHPEISQPFLEHRIECRVNLLGAVRETKASTNGAVRRDGALGPARRPELDGPYPAQPPGPRPDRSTRRCRRASHRPHPIRRETRRQKPRAVGSGRYQTGPPRLRSRRRYRRRDSQSRPVRLFPESHECTYVIEPGISRLVRSAQSANASSDPVGAAGSWTHRSPNSSSCWRRTRPRWERKSRPRYVSTRDPPAVWTSR